MPLSLGLRALCFICVCKLFFSPPFNNLSSSHLYTRSGTIKGTPSLILDLKMCSVHGLCPLICKKKANFFLYHSQHSCMAYVGFTMSVSPSVSSHIQLSVDKFCSFNFYSYAGMCFELSIVIL